jgi:hypothetical protein
VRKVVQVGRVTSKNKTRKSQSQNSKKRTARRSVGFKSDGWYANAVLSIGVSAKAD